MVRRVAWLVVAAAFAAACGGGEGSGSVGASTTGSSSSTTIGAGGQSSASTGDSSSSGKGDGGGGPDGHLAEWVRTFKGSEQSASSVAVDGQGNIYVGGSFTSGMVEFGNGQLDCPMTLMGMQTCGYLIKLDPAGNPLWTRAFAAGHTLSIDVTALGVAADGVVIAARWQRYQGLHSPLDLGAGPLDPAGDSPMVLARFDPDGAPLWSAAYGDDAGEVVPASLIVEGPGKFLVAGGFSTASLDFGPGAMPYAGLHTVFVARFEGKTAMWQKSFGGMMAQKLGGLGRDLEGNLLLTGSFEQSLSFGGPPLTSPGGPSLFHATLDAAGAFVASRSFPSAGAIALVTGVATDAAGSTLVTGKFDGTLDLGAKPLVCQGDVNAYLAKIDAKGEVVFARAITEPMTSQDGSFCVAADPSNNILWGSELYFSGITEDYIQGRIEKLDPSGATLWSVAGKNFGARAFAFDAAGGVIAVGEFSSGIDFAKGGPIAGTKGTNAFIAKFSP